MARRQLASPGSARGPRMAPGSRQSGMDAAFPGRQFRPGEKRGTAVGKTKVGKGSKVMVIADRQGLPIGLHVDNARLHESQLVATILATVRVPRPRGLPRTLPKEIMANKAYDSRRFCRNLRRGMKPTIPMFAWRPRRHLKRGQPICTGPNYRHRWKVESSHL